MADLSAPVPSAPDHAAPDHAHVAPAPGFADPPIDGARAFRAMLHALAEPGTIQDIATAPAPLGPVPPAALAACLVLVDAETPLWLDAAARTPEVEAFLRFHLGCPLVDRPSEAAFALIADPMAMPPLDAFRAGTDEAPEGSTTLILCLETLTNGADGARLTGPGIEHARHVSPGPLPPAFWRWVAANHALYPKGVDLFLTRGHRVAGLPRSTRIGEG